MVERLQYQIVNSPTLTPFQPFHLFGAGFSAKCVVRKTSDFRLGEWLMVVCKTLTPLA